jgi:hypothetical protein
MDAPDHVVYPEAYEAGYWHFFDGYEQLHEYLHALQHSSLDFSDTIMNMQGAELPELESPYDGDDPVSPARLGVHPLTISEYIDHQMPEARSEQYDSESGDLEDAFVSWQGGALAALKEQYPRT